MDALSTVLASLSAPEGLYIESKLSEPWRIKFESQPDAWEPFLPQCHRIFFLHYVVAGRLCLEMGDAAPVDLGPQAFVLLPHGATHHLSSADGVQSRGAHRLIRPSSRDGLFQIASGGGAQGARVISGVFGAPVRDRPLLSTLPATLVIPTGASPDGVLIRQSLDLAAREIALAGAGAISVLSSLTRLALMAAARDHLTKLSVDKGAHLASLHDAAVSKVLTIMHMRYAQSWTTEALARQVGLSRSSFAERFAKLVGVSPMRYLASWRMKMAAQQLRDGGSSAGQTAFDVGFSSEAAFNRAFKREFGTPPASWRKRLEGAGTSLSCLLMAAIGLLNTDLASVLGLADVF